MAESRAPGELPNRRDLYKKVLEKTRKILLENLSEVDEILDCLRRDEILTDIKYRDLKDAMRNKTTTDAIRQLLDTVLLQSKTNYETFLTILLETKNEYAHEELRKAGDALEYVYGELRKEENALGEEPSEPHEDIAERLQEIDLK